MTRLFDHTVGNVDALQSPVECAEVPVDEPEPAPDVEGTHAVEASEPALGELEEDVGLRLEEEVVIAPRERDRVLDLVFVRVAMVVGGGYGDLSKGSESATDVVSAAEERSANPRVSSTR